MNSCYNWWIAPAICHALNGYWPSMDYQTLPWHEFGTIPGNLFSSGFQLFINSFGRYAGDIPGGVAIGVCIALAVVVARYQDFEVRIPGTPPFLAARWFTGAMAAGFLLILALMNVMMYLRHKSLLWEDVQRIYYWTPQTLLVMILAAFALSLLQRQGMRLDAARIVLAVLLFSNIYAMPSHWKYFRNGHLAGNFTLGQMIRTGLSDKAAGRAVAPNVAATPAFIFIDAKAREFRALFGLGNP